MESLLKNKSGKNIFHKFDKAGSDMVKKGGSNDLF